MLRQTLGFVSRRAVFSTLLAMVLSASAFASQPPSTGLGQSWPNAADVSVSPHYHVYIFVRDGIRYIQVNDLNGTVRGAVAVADHVVLVLPVGVDASSVTTSTLHDTNQVLNVSGETIYRDSSLQINAIPENTGAVQLVVTPMDTSDTCTSVFNCTGGSVTSDPSNN
jgi:hypothetical protein